MELKIQSKTLPLLRVFLCVLCVSVVNPPFSRATEPLFTNNLEKAEEGDPPADIVVLSGTFTVKTADGNKFLEMAADPLDHCGVLFGPEGPGLLGVSARIYATSSGKRTPEFGVGLADTSGYKLAVMPAKNELQLLKGEDVKAAIPFQWKSGTWTVMSLQVRKTGEGKYTVEGKAWEHGKEEPKEWPLKWEETEELSKGRSSAWGIPFAGTPIRFDDLTVVKSGDE